MAFERLPQALEGLNVQVSYQPLLLAGFVALFHPPALGAAGSLAWFLGTLMLVYLGFGIATIAHQSWGAALTQLPPPFFQPIKMLPLAMPSSIAARSGSRGRRR